MGDIQKVGVLLLMLSVVCTLHIKMPRMRAAVLQAAHAAPSPRMWAAEAVEQFPRRQIFD